jgi:hypothetical protein
LSLLLSVPVSFGFCAAGSASVGAEVEPEPAESFPWSSVGAFVLSAGCSDGAAGAGVEVPAAAELSSWQAVRVSAVRSAAVPRTEVRATRRK